MILLLQGMPIAAASHTEEGHHAVGTAPTCWSVSGRTVRATCTAGGSVCGKPEQFPAWINTAIPQHGEQFVFAYDGVHFSSTDAIKRWPGAMLRYSSPSTYTAAMPAHDTNDGLDYLYVFYWNGGTETSFRVQGAGSLPNSGHFEFAANGNQYTLRIDGAPFASFQIGPSTGGWSGPGFLVGCLAKSVSLTWAEYGWRSIGGEDGCWSTARGVATFDCIGASSCGTTEQHVGWVDHTRRLGNGFTFSYRGNAIESTDALMRHPGAILRWTSPSNFVAATPIVDEYGRSTLYVMEWRNGVESASTWPGLRTLPQEATYTFQAVGSLYLVYVNGALFSLFEAGPSTGGKVGVGTLLGCNAQTTTHQEWSQMTLVR